jgi:hypothetical protein
MDAAERLSEIYSSSIMLLVDDGGGVVDTAAAEVAGLDEKQQHLNQQLHQRLNQQLLLTNNNIFTIHRATTETVTAAPQTGLFGLPISTLVIIAGVLVFVMLIMVSAVAVSSGKDKRRYGRYPPGDFGPYYGPDMIEPYEYEPIMTYDEEVFEEEEFEEEYAPPRSYGTVGNQYGRYATSIAPCPYCGHPTRGDQSFCMYCYRKIA